MFGIQMMTLQIFFNNLYAMNAMRESFIKKNPVIVTCIFLCVESVLAWAVGKYVRNELKAYLGTCCARQSDADQNQFDANRNRSDANPSEQTIPVYSAQLVRQKERAFSSLNRGVGNEYRLGSRYMDLSTPFFSVLVCFFAQASLMMYYMRCLNDMQAIHSEDEIKWIMWVVGAAVMLSAEGALGETFDGEFWHYILHDFAVDYEAEKEAIAKPYCIKGRKGLPVQWSVRCLFDFVINEAGRKIVLGTAAILICTSDRMSFIKDSMCIFFVVTLDDLSEAKYLHTMLGSMIPDDAPAKEDARANSTETETQGDEQQRLVP
jgi:hypothetical protein